MAVSYRVSAPNTITAPPNSTTASRIAVCTWSGSRATKALARNAPGNATTPISSANAMVLPVIAPASAEHHEPRPADEDREHGVGCDHRLAGEARGHQSDSRMTPAPTVPPTAAP